MLLLYVLLGSARVYSYSLDNHQQITRDAVDLINTCAQQESFNTLNPASQLDALVHYNLHQDALWRKARLWHFPNNKHHPPEKSATIWIGNTLVISTSFDVWTDYL